MPVVLYWQTSHQWKQDNTRILQNAQASFSQALRAYQQFLSLLDFRLRNSLKKGELDKIPVVLAQKIERLASASFPEIISIRFIPVSQPQVLYSRLGKSAASPQTHSFEKDTTLSLGDGQFETRKILYDTRQNRVGQLYLNFSLKHVIQLGVPGYEFKVLPLSKDALRSGLSFDIPGLPYVFVLNRTAPSFWQCLINCRFSLFFLVISTSLSLLVGTFYGHMWLRKRWKSLLRKHKALAEQLAPVEETNAQQKITIEKLTQILQLKADAAMGKNRLFSALQERFRQIAMQALGLNSLLTKLLSEESSESKQLMLEIKNISQENSALLKRLVKGHPIAENDQAIDFLACFEKIHNFCLAELMERELTVKTVGKIKEPLYADRFLLELVLYNIFHKIIDRHMKGGMIKVEFKNTPHLQIVFHDNGFDMETAERAVQNKPDISNTLSLSKSRLQELVHSFGWSVTFERTKGPFHHSTTLSIPKLLHSETSSNVVSLFALKKRFSEEMESHP